MPRAVDRTPKPCTHPRVSHEHGTHLAYDKDGCRCVPCAQANARTTARERYLRAVGRQDRVDATPAREHVRALLQTLTVGQIERRSGVNRTSIRCLLGEHPGVPMTKRVTYRTAARLLAVQPSRVGPEKGGLVDSTGTIRRVQALVTLGWDLTSIYTRIGATSSTTWKLTSATPPQWVTVDLRDRVRALYDELSMTPRPASWQAAAAQKRARARGWAPPLAWDEESIDDPSATPDPGQPQAHRGGGSYGIDLGEVEFLLEGGASVWQVTAQLGTSESAIAMAAYRGGRPDLAVRFNNARQRDWSAAS